MKLVTACLIGLLVASPLLAQEPQSREQPQREHVVKRGDTLWDLAGFYLSNPFRWPRIYEANPLVVEDPHWIYPQEVLVIPGLVADARPAPVRDAAPAAVAPPTAERSARTIFYREPPPRAQRQDPTVLSEPGVMDPPVRPGQFQSAEFLANPDGLAVMGRMIRTVRNVGDMNDEPTTAHPQDVVFLSYGGVQQPRVGERLVMVRVGRRVPGAGRGIRIIHPTAVVRVQALNPEVMEVRVEHQFETVNQHQAAVPLDLFPDFLAPRAEPVEGPDLEGQVIEFLDAEQTLYGQTARAFINLGRQHGVQVGDVFVAYLPEREAGARAPGEYRRFGQQLPSEAVAELIVIRTMDNTATVQVEQLLLPVLEDGIAIRRIRKMP